MEKRLDVGQWLPWSVFLYDAGNETEVAILDPATMVSVSNGLGVEVEAQEARIRLRRVATVLQRVYS